MGTYIGLRLDKLSTNRIKEYLETLEIENTIPIEDLHCTLFYCKNQDIVNYEIDKDKKYSSYVIGYDILGEGEWKALVLKLFSPSMYKQHYKIRDLGYEHSYKEFIPHISLKYVPEYNDLDLLIKNSPIGMNLNFKNEYKEELKD